MNGRKRRGKKPKQTRKTPKPSRVNRRRKEKRAAKIGDGCAGKKRYLTLDEARADARALLERTVLRSTGVYLCGTHYHVTSGPHESYGNLVTIFDKEVFYPT